MQPHNVYYQAFHNEKEACKLDLIISNNKNRWKYWCLLIIVSIGCLIFKMSDKIYLSLYCHMRQREAAIITIRKQEQEQGTDVCWTITLIINNLSEQMLLAFIAMDHWIMNDMSFFCLINTPKVMILSLLSEKRKKYSFEKLETLTFPTLCIYLWTQTD